MSADGQELGAAAPPLHRVRFVLPVFAAAVFVSALLLFLVQPMFTKMVLPRLGGSPSVWSVALVFFQAMLLAGYLYAHLSVRCLDIRLALFAHIVLTAAALFALPLSMASGWGDPPESSAALWLIALFAASIGLPFFALAANAPLLQAWFVRTGHPAAADPYFLYAASNAGSFLALLSYPLLVEPFVRLRDQARLWSDGYMLLLALIVLCALLLRRTATRQPQSPAPAAGERVPWRDAATWTALAAVPSALLVATTAHISTDVAASPLLWVVPLALYLLTFVIVFQRRPLVPHGIAVAIQPLFVLFVVLVIALEVLHYVFATMAANLAAFFFAALVCHGELARRRPPARLLTSFYLWMAAGGMLGGIFSALLAPKLFYWVAEYPLLIVLAVLCRPGTIMGSGRPERLAWLAVLIAAVVIMLSGLRYRFDVDQGTFDVAIALLAVATLIFSQDPLKYATVIALAFMLARVHEPGIARREFARSFFGVYKITDTADGRFRILTHGTTEHGAQRIRDADGNPVTGRPEPLTYYHSSSPIAQAIASVRARMNAPIRIAAVGLGAGTTACLSRPGEAVDFYEIDPLVVTIAKTRFTYLSACAPDAAIIIGDARLTLARAPAGRYDVIVMDAFTSDAIPIHLMTQEAMAIYADKLAPGGLILMHVSNRHMELASVVAGIAAASGLQARLNDAGRDEDDANYRFSSTVVAVARREDDFGSLDGSEDWVPQEPDPDQWVWTDDYSNVIGAMIRQLK